MRPIEKKVYSKITDKGISFDDIMEIVDSTPVSEKKKSYPDDCLFQSERYFAKNIVDSLLRNKLIKQEGSRYFKIEKPKKEES